ncbi:MAG: malate dehydrogenase, partial [Proteobacteria bacterium]|nr:malate dehydrogenase [Pseudomonadota bacterium]
MSGIDKKIVTVSVTGATGHIGYAILFRILSGNLFGKDIKVNLQIIDINDEKIKAALSGV